MDFKDPRAQRTVLLMIAMLGIGYLYFFATFVPFGYRAMMSEKKDLQAKYEQLSNDLNKARQTLANMARVEREFEEINKKYQAAQTLLPEDKEVANLLRMVALVGQQSGVKFNLFRPMPAAPQGYYVENPVSVKVVGGYHDVGNFLAEVANLSRIVNVKNLLIEENKKSEDDEGAVEATFTASAYTLNPNPAVEADDEGGAAADAPAEPKVARSRKARGGK